MKQIQLRDVTEISLFAALIYLSVAVFHFTVGSQFIHFGNAMVVVGVLLFGSKKGAAAATIGLGIYDLLSGYASVAWITVLESLIVCLVLHGVYEVFYKRDDSSFHIVIAGVVAALIKIVLNLIKYTLFSVVGGEVSFVVSFLGAAVKIIGSYGTAVATVVAVPLLYPIFKKVVSQMGTKN